MKRPRNHRTGRTAYAIALAMLAAAAIAACGGSSTTKSTTTAPTSTGKTKTATAASTAFTACLKAHGVTAPTRPAGRAGNPASTTTGTGTSPTPQTGTGGTPPKQDGAPPTGAKRPTKPGQGGGFAGGGPAAGSFGSGNSKLAKALKTCEAKLGTSGAPAGPRTGATRGTVTPHFSSAELKSYVACVRKDGYPAMPEPNTTGKGAVFPSSIEKNAKFQAANKKCQSILRSTANPPSTAGPTTTSTSSTPSDASND